MPRKKATAETESIPVESVVEEIQGERVVPQTSIPKDVDPNTIVLVKNGFHGRLVYVSPRTKETYYWDNFGDEQELELRELRNAKSSAKGFFENNWFMFDEENEWVIPYLGLTKYYKNALRLKEFDQIFKMTPAKAEAAIEKLSNGQKSSLAYRAAELVSSKEIDSLKMINMLERVLGVELVEK